MGYNHFAYMMIRILDIMRNFFGSSYSYIIINILSIPAVILFTMLEFIMTIPSFLSLMYCSIIIGVPITIVLYYLHRLNSIQRSKMHNMIWFSFYKNLWMNQNLTYALSGLIWNQWEKIIETKDGKVLLKVLILNCFLQHLLWRQPCWISCYGIVMMNLQRNLRQLL